MTINYQLGDCDKLVRSFKLAEILLYLWIIVFWNKISFLILSVLIK